ncbi:hypothetical protein [Marispirochaeta aestuarii]|uniref:hypothetical protein n=1 Tax=Marispirochaeta aestuarii TaxID=1963862 RepID=UPI0029C744D6|nr:hypothetical protein [Marispirochaeta aestuarii]
MNRRFPSIPATIILAALVLLLPQVQLLAQERIYWDDSRVLGLESPRFPQAGSSYQGIVVMAHEYEYSGQDQGRAYISTAYSSDSLQWETHSRVLGPFSFSGDESPIASLAVTAGGEVYLAVAEDESTIGIYQSRNQGGSFSRISSITAPVSAIVAPRLFLNSRGEFVLLFPGTSGPVQAWAATWESSIPAPKTAHNGSLSPPDHGKYPPGDLSAFSCRIRRGGIMSFFRPSRPAVPGEIPRRVISSIWQAVSTEAGAGANLN